MQLCNFNHCLLKKLYARSKWCLDEVLTIIEEKEKAGCKHEVVPLFYNIDPSDVRNQKRSFEEAFGGYEDTIKAETNPQKKEELSEKVKAWRDSLRTAGSLTGMVLTDEGYEAKFISNVVMDIRKKLDYKTMFTEEKLVGIYSKVVEIESWLQDPSPDAIFLLVAGMGGIGKTTIAKCIYNLYSHKYDGSCFLADINEPSNQSETLRRLQSQLLFDILKSGHEETIWNVHTGTTKVENAIGNKKVLLILDDVTTEEQLNALLGRKRFHPGSKVIITTRHKELVHAFALPPKVHIVTELSPDESLKLFSLFCFYQDQPIEPYIVRSERVVDSCMGLPLALKVLGSSLRGKNIVEWEDAMRKLEAIQHPEIQNVLRLSYDSLEDATDKDLFLHIACFFVREDKDYIVKILAECDLYPIVGIKNLTDRCLVDVGGGKVWMHRLIREMGQEVVRQESPKCVGKRSRLWRHGDSFKVLQEHEGTKKVEGFKLDVPNMEESSFQEYVGTHMHGDNANFEFGALDKMPNILLLQLKYVTFFGEYKNLPTKLRLLSWHGFSGDYIPIDIPLEKLVVLDLRYSKLKCVWDNFKLIGSLKILNLVHCVELIKTPDFSGLPGLESLILRGCLRLTKVGDSIAYLEQLVSLDLTDCRSLRCIPRFPASLASLQMSGCPNLERFRCLDSISFCSHLVNVNISHCNLIDESFPNEWRNLLSLDSLNISENNITSLPNCIQSLPKLTILYVNGCSNVRSISGLPKSLFYLTIDSNESLEEVHIAQCPTTAIKGKHFSKLCHIEGLFKLQPIDKVDTKVIRYLGIKSVRGGVKQKVLFEYGISSTIASKKQIPTKFMYKEKGPKVSFKVPLHHSSSRICGMSMCFVISKLKRSMLDQEFCRMRIEVYNKTKDLSWEYDISDRPCDMKKYGLLSLWRCGNLLEDGEEINVQIDLVTFNLQEHRRVEESCLNILYEDEEVDGEREDLSVFDQISWTDRMFVDISNYIHSGKYSFPSLITFTSYNFWVHHHIYEKEEDGGDNPLAWIDCNGMIDAGLQWQRHMRCGERPRTHWSLDF